MLKMSSIAQRASAVAALLAAAAALPATAHAAAGALDHTFADNGRSEHWVADQRSREPWTTPSAVWPGGANRIVVQAPGPLRVGAGGAQDLSFGTGGTLPYGSTRLPGGRWLVASPGCCPAARPAPADLDGHALPSVPAFQAALTSLGDQSNSALIGLGDGTVLDVVASSVTQARVTKLKLDGRVVGAAKAIKGSAVSALGQSAGSVTSGTGVIAGSATGVVRLRQDGSLDPAWGSRLAVIKHFQPLQLARWGHGGVAVLGRDLAEDTYVLRLISRTGHVAHRIQLATGVGNDFGGTLFGAALATDAKGRVLIAKGEVTLSTISVRRYDTTGLRVDKTFATRGTAHLRASRPSDVRAMTVMPDGRVVVVGALEQFGRVRDDRQDFTSPGWEQHGTVLWRLTAR